MAHLNTIYFIRTTSEFDKDLVRSILDKILGPDSLERILYIGDSFRVFVVAFWRVPLVNLFHDSYSLPINSLHGNLLPWYLERIDPYAIFRDGNFPAPHFLRNSKNFTDSELDSLGIGGAAEFLYVQLPTSDGTLFWEMFRDGIYYMPDLSFYNQPKLEPLQAVDCPSTPSLSPLPILHSCGSFQRWRDFYLEHPSTWPKDLSDVERAALEKQYSRLFSFGLWQPECGRDPTNLAQHQLLSPETSFPYRWDFRKF